VNYQSWEKTAENEQKNRLLESVSSFHLLLLLRSAVPTGIEPVTSNLGETELLDRIWGEKQYFRCFLHFTSHFVTLQAAFGNDHSFCQMFMLPAQGGLLRVNRYS
jgi:hypothetical protein